MTELVRYPGYERLVGPTFDWKDPAPEDWVWTAYRLVGDGMAERRRGFCADREDAFTAARTAFETKCAPLPVITCPHCKGSCPCRNCLGKGRVVEKA